MKEVNLQYCPTLAIIADHMTKPLVRSKFRELKSFAVVYLNRVFEIVLRVHSKCPSIYVL